MIVLITRITDVIYGDFLVSLTIRWTNVSVFKAMETKLKFKQNSAVPQGSVLDPLLCINNHTLYNRFVNHSLRW
jgi:hypothetical protein